VLMGAAPGPGPSPSQAEAGRRFQKCPEAGYESLFFKCSSKKDEIKVFLFFFLVSFSLRLNQRCLFPVNAMLVVLEQTDGERWGVGGETIVIKHW